MEMEFSRPLGTSPFEISFDQTNNITLGLPQIVWLRGDEPYFNEFTLTADEVMNQLGLKRSRLNQISGKELRVGRTKIDRYIRPVYRIYDVEQYKEWIRPTYSHKKSSEVIDDAVKQLEDASSEIKEIIHKEKPQWFQEHEIYFQDEIKNLNQDILAVEQALQNTIQEKITQELEVSKIFAIKQQHAIQGIHEQLATLCEKQITFDLFKQVLAEVMTCVQEVQSGQNKISSEISQLKSDFKKQINEEIETLKNSMQTSCLPTSLNRMQRRKVICERNKNIETYFIGKKKQESHKIIFKIKKRKKVFK